MPDTLHEEILGLQAQIERQLKLKGSFPEQARRAKRHVPRGMQKRLATLASALELMDHPRLALTLDQSALLRDVRALSAYLNDVDLADRRRGRLLDMATTVGFAVLAVIGLLVLVLRWRGFI
ncbi:hypothetical protein TRM7557_03328 [Tritonibacter multivorans]|uniref:Uncharacterized protein n=1 Tax=Tritonibacter multivorans TaxID=928856 RepID=A0A0P1GHS8_9RHOB|nr:hypothetical protein [Tritonibacter multivorans]MDA7420614.1 hypothetical protein [Tritonibacter multivorans]CUH81268.1 hypothetical protein TRM7557_03328 [Tritonibacter multivorans]SFC31974.1 hypothetical protein SAMN04488049_102164 [Tritonibacter multivorans]